MARERKRHREAKKLDHVDIPIEEILAVVEADEPVGFCIACGNDVWGVEPDARGYVCEACGESTVYGAEELLIGTVA